MESTKILNYNNNFQKSISYNYVNISVGGKPSAKPYKL